MTDELVRGYTYDMTYTMKIRTETANGVRTETHRNLLEGDLLELREAARVAAEPGDTVIITEKRN